MNDRNESSDDFEDRADRIFAGTTYEQCIQKFRHYAPYRIPGLRAAALRRLKDLLIEEEDCRMHHANAEPIDYFIESP